jgi:hypothetical protein
MGNKSLKYPKSVKNNNQLNNNNNNNNNNRNGFLNEFSRKKRRQSSEPSIFRAIEDNDISGVKQLIKSGHNINKVDINGLSALHCAAINGNEECVKLLIEFGSKLKSCSPLRMTSLHFAAQNANRNVINMLIDYGEVVNAKDLMGDTPLSSAVQVNNIETAIALLMRGAVLHSHVVVSAIEYGFNDLLRHLINFRPNIVSVIDFKNFRFTRVAVLGLKLLYYSGFKFSDSFCNECQPLDWIEFCLSDQIRLPPAHYNLEKDLRAFQQFSEWLDEQQRQPISLKCLSRIAFRKTCDAHNINHVLTHIKLPFVINDYLLLNDIL